MDRVSADDMLQRKMALNILSISVKKPCLFYEKVRVSMVYSISDSCQNALCINVCSFHPLSPALKLKFVTFLSFPFQLNNVLQLPCNSFFTNSFSLLLLVSANMTLVTSTSR
jgi:hypothetical protein